MHKQNVFIATGVNRLDDVRKPTITVFPDPLNAGKFLACFQATDCDEMIDGYSYDELLSIRNAISDALTDMDVKETVLEYNKNNPKFTRFKD
jgi:UDP-N-acetylglucosamine enolpyruvyl transferase